MSWTISIESYIETISVATESDGENPEALRGSGIQVGDRKSLTEGWGQVNLPPSLVSKLREASRRTGLSLESLIWDAVDFYLEKELYQLIGISPSSDTSQNRGTRSANIRGQS